MSANVSRVFTRALYKFIKNINMLKGFFNHIAGKY